MLHRFIFDLTVTAADIKESDRRYALDTYDAKFHHRYDAKNSQGHLCGGYVNFYSFSPIAVAAQRVGFHDAVVMNGVLSWDKRFKPAGFYAEGHCTSLRFEDINAGYGDLETAGIYRLFVHANVPDSDNGLNVYCGDLTPA